MTTENALINKSYYQTIVDENSGKHPIETLGEMYTEEMKKDSPDLSSIRFAQGEVYFLNQDYEAAIFKWQHPLDNHLYPWAQKNIADAHMEMGLLDYAENHYKDVETESTTLQTEVLLQLFSLYIQQDDLEKSVRTIKKAVRLNPDYTDVTNIAKRYFEEIQDWNHAVELAVNEAVRTESPSWLNILKQYAELGYTSGYEPAYFNEVIVTSFYVDKEIFEDLVEALWKDYKESDAYFLWLEEINQLLTNLNLERALAWKKLPDLYAQGYNHLTSGNYLIRDIKKVMHAHLMNWVELSSGEDSQLSSTAVLAWNERFPGELDGALVQEAELQFRAAPAIEDGRLEGLELFQSIKAWAEKEGVAEEFSEFLRSRPAAASLGEASPSEIRDVIKDSLNYLAEQRLALENVIIEEIDNNQEILIELEGDHEHMDKMKREKAEIMTTSFRELMNRLAENVQVQLPERLRESSYSVLEESDLSTLHNDLNSEMNLRIAKYMEEDALPTFILSFEEWLQECEREFQESQEVADEMNERINQQFNEEKVYLSGDFQVLDDWQRDIDRTSRLLVRTGDVNILLRNNPSQLMLKGAGKLFGLTKNKDILLGRYKDYIENADYRGVAEKTIKPFIQQLELFEESIEWDVGRFFSAPQEELNRTLEEVQADIDRQKDLLNEMRERPEIYQNPLMLFELKLRQFEMKHMIETTS